MTTEQYSIGYDEGYQVGWNAAMDAKPAQRTWVGLTEPEINDCYESIMFDQNIEPSRMGVYLEIEAKLKEKNA